MCGRARCTLNRERMAAATGVPPEGWRESESFQPTENLHPGMRVPVTYENDKGQREIRTMRWGLVPSFTKHGEKLDFFRMFNARCEGVAEKPIFNRLLKSHRCVVVLDGFYEWKQEGSGKQPYYIWLGEGRPMKMAGLYDILRNEDGNEVCTFTILTTDSAKRLQWLHDRMPVILRDEEAVKLWLQRGTAPDPKTLQGVYEPYNEQDLSWHPVTRKLSNMAYQGPDCSKDVRQQGLGAFFKPKVKPGKQGPSSDAPAVKHEAHKNETGTLPTANSPEDKALQDRLGRETEHAHACGGGFKSPESSAAGPAHFSAEDCDPVGSGVRGQGGCVVKGKGGRGEQAEEGRGGRGAVKEEEGPAVKEEEASESGLGVDVKGEERGEGPSETPLHQGAFSQVGEEVVKEEGHNGGGAGRPGSRGGGGTPAGQGKEEAGQMGIAGHGKGEPVEKGKAAPKRKGVAGAAARGESVKKAKLMSPGTKQGTLDSFFTKNPL